MRRCSLACCPNSGCAAAQYGKRSGVPVPDAAAGRVGGGADVADQQRADHRQRTRRITRPARTGFFDGQVMSQTGVFEGVPVYADTTLEPYSERLCAGRRRSYARLRTAARSGSSPARPAVSAVVSGREPIRPGGAAIGSVRHRPERPDIRTDGRRDPARGRRCGRSARSVPMPRRTSIIDGDRRRPARQRCLAGIWRRALVQRRAAQCRSRPDRFEQIGEYRGFPVYRDKISGSDDIWIAVVKDGPLAPYRNARRLSVALAARYS